MRSAWKLFSKELDYPAARLVHKDEAIFTVLAGAGLERVILRDKVEYGAQKQDE